MFFAQKIHYWGVARESKKRLDYWTKKTYDDEVRKFVRKIRNGANYWFTFVLHPEVESTNNGLKSSNNLWYSVAL